MTIGVQGVFDRILGFLGGDSRCRKTKKCSKKILGIESCVYDYRFKYGLVEKGSYLDQSVLLFDLQGNVCIECVYAHTDNASHVRLYEYGEKGQLNRLVLCSTPECKDGAILKIKRKELMILKMEEEVLYEYNSDKTIKEITGKLSLLDAIYEDGYKCCYVYGNKEVERRIYDELGLYLFSLVSDDRGVLLYKIGRSSSSSVRSMIGCDRYIYDHRSRLVRVEKKVYKRKIVKEKYEYNEYDDRVLVYTSKLRCKIKYRYEYDDCGNWIERKDDFSKDISGKSFVDGMIAERTIVYQNESNGGKEHDVELFAYVKKLINNMR